MTAWRQANHHHLNWGRLLSHTNRPCNDTPTPPCGQRCAAMPDLFRMPAKPCNCNAVHFNPTTVRFCSLSASFQRWHVVVNAPNLHKSARSVQHEAYIDNEWETWKWWILWRHIFIPIMLPLLPQQSCIYFRFKIKAWWLTADTCKNIVYDCEFCSISDIIVVALGGIFCRFILRLAYMISMQNIFSLTN